MSQSENLSDCWIDIYMDDNYEGQHARLYGPARYPNMRIEGQNWHDEIDSCKVGPNAYVRCYVDELFENTELWLLPGEEIGCLDTYGFGDSIDSIEILNHPPTEKDRGYVEYLEAMNGRGSSI